MIKYKISICNVYKRGLESTEKLETNTIKHYV